MPTIPPHAHLIWLGPRLGALPYVAALALLDRGGLESATLHYEDEAFPEHPLVRDLAARPGFSLRRIDAEALLAEVPPAIRSIYPLLTHRPSRSNLFRLLILWHEGGIYLDTDAITLQPLTPLLGDPGFAGLERIAFPAALYDTRNPLRWAQAGLLTAVRDLVRRAFFDPGAAFRRIERFYPLAANNAVLGAHPHHPTVESLLDRIAVMKAEEAVRRYRLGPQLFERVTTNRSSKTFRLHPPRAFYPLPPEICQAYVRDDPDGRLGDRPHPDTFVAHVYDSVLSQRLGRPVDAAYFRETRGRTLLARMVAPYLDSLFNAAPLAAP